MTSFTVNRVSFIFKMICLALTTFIVTEWIQRYSLHKLSSVIDVKSYFTSEMDVAPVFSICVADPKLDEKIVQFSSEYNESDYVNFLKGNVYYEELRQLDFERIKFNWSDYFYETPEAHLVSDNGRDTRFAHMGKYWKYYTSYIGLQSHERYLTYCLAFEPLRREVHAIRVRLNKSLFNNGKRPDYKFRVYLHYPNQIIRAYQNVKYLWDDWKDKINQMVFSVRDFEILQRFEGKHSTCIKDWRNYDKIIMEQHLGSIGCRRPYQDSKTIKQICSDTKTMDESGIYPSNIVMKMFNEPCRTIEKASFKFLDSKTTSKNVPKEVFEIKFYFNSRYKEILQYEQIDLEVSKN